jgi:hypothetical protein
MALFNGAQPGKTAVATAPERISLAPREVWASAAQLARSVSCPGSTKNGSVAWSVGTALSLVVIRRFLH